jgi:hypothetical protein
MRLALAVQVVTPARVVQEVSRWEDLVATVGLALADPAEAFKLVRVSPQPVGKAVKPGNPTDAVGVAAEAERR